MKLVYILHTNSTVFSMFGLTGFPRILVTLMLVKYHLTDIVQRGIGLLLPIFGKS